MVWHCCGRRASVYLGNPPRASGRRISGVPMNNDEGRKPVIIGNRAFMQMLFHWTETLSPTQRLDLGGALDALVRGATEKRCWQTAKRGVGARMRAYLLDKMLEHNIALTQQNYLPA